VNMTETHASQLAWPTRQLIAKLGCGQSAESPAAVEPVNTFNDGG